MAHTGGVVVAESEMEEARKSSVYVPPLARRPGMRSRLRRAKPSSMVESILYTKLISRNRVHAQSDRRVAPRARRCPRWRSAKRRTPKGNRNS